MVANIKAGGVAFNVLVLKAFNGKVRKIKTSAVEDRSAESRRQDVAILRYDEVSA